MRVYGHGRFTKGHIQNHIRCLAAYAWEGFQFWTGTWHLSSMQIHQHPASLMQMPGFAAKETDGLDVVFQAMQTQVQHLLWGRGHHK